MRTFTDSAGKKWTARETGIYFGSGAVTEDDSLPQDCMAFLSFQSETGERVVGEMRRGTIEVAPEEQLRRVLGKAYESLREVE